MEFIEKSDFVVEKTERVTAIIECDLVPLLPEFIKNRNEDLKLIGEFIKAKNFDSIKKMGHDLRGVPGAFGYDFLVDIGFKIEMAARNQDIEVLNIVAKQYEKLMKIHEIIIEGDDKIYHVQDFT